MKKSTREEYPLSPRKVIKKTIASTLAWTLFLFFLWGVVAVASSLDTSNLSFLFNAGTIVIVILLAIIIIPTYLYQRWYFATYHYDLADDYIVIKKNPITPKEITIPYERIQDVYVDQDILDRIFGLYDVYLSSATVSSGMEAHIDGVEKTAAEGLRAALLQTVKDRISKSKKTKA